MPCKNKQKTNKQTKKNQAKKTPNNKQIGKHHRKNKEKKLKQQKTKDKQKHLNIKGRTSLYFHLYLTTDYEQRLNGVRLFISDGNPNYSPLYEHPSNASIPETLLVSLETPVKLDRVALQAPGRCRILDMCEVEVYGGT